MESTVIEALAEAVTQSATVCDQNTPSLASTPHEIIKGINLDPLRQRNEGIIPLVFFDVRSAKIARDVVLDKKFNDRLRQCIGGGAQGGSPSTELSARLITLDELCKVIFIIPSLSLSDTYAWPQILGNSRFLDGIDGSFWFSVERIQQNDNEGIDPIVVQNILKRFGDIRSFKFIQQEVDQQGVSFIGVTVDYVSLIIIIEIQGRIPS